MSISTAVYDALVRDTTISGAVTGVYRLRAPENTDAPYIILQAANARRETHLQGVTQLERSEQRVHLFGPDYTALESLRNTIIDRMSSSLGAIHLLSVEMYEDDVRLFHLVADFVIWDSVS